MAKRPVSLLSGLLTCGCCGGRYGLIMRDRFGCLNHHRRGTCDNNRTIPREKIEQRVLSGLNDKLISADSVAEAVRAYTQEMNRLNHDAHRTAPTAGPLTRSTAPLPASSRRSRTACISR